MSFFKKNYRFAFLIILFLVLIYLGKNYSQEASARNQNLSKDARRQTLSEKLSDKILYAWNSLGAIFFTQKDSVQALKERGAASRPRNQLSLPANDFESAQNKRRRQAERTINERELAMAGDINKEEDPLKEKQINFFRELPYGVLNQEYCVYLDPQWGNGPYQWSINEGRIPNGLKLGTKNGMLCGTPTAAGLWIFKIEIAEESLRKIVIQYSLLISQHKEEETAGDLEIITQGLSSGFVGVDYVFQFGGTGGKLPYFWSVSSLPDGLNFEPHLGMIHGSPLEQGTMTLNVSLTDGLLGQTAKSFNFLVETSVPNIINYCGGGIIGEPYTCQLQGQGGYPPYRWEMISGAMPEGLNFDPKTATIAGIPIKAQSETAVIQLTDSQGGSDVTEVKIDILTHPFKIITDRLDEGVVGANYYQTLEAIGGVPFGPGENISSYRWDLVSGNLPEGIEFQNTGVLLGTPVKDFNADIFLRVTDKTGSTDFQSFNLRIKASKLEIVTKYLKEGYVGQEYSQLLEAQGGTPPYYWQSESPFPKGISLNADGVLEGTPQEEFSGNVTIVVTDSAQSPNTDMDSREYILHIKKAALEIVGDPSDRLPTAIYQEYYAYPLQAQGGVPPYDWKISSGNLPKGLSLSTEGLIFGTPEEFGNNPFNFVVEVWDSEENFGTKDLEMYVIEKPLNIIKEKEPPDGSIDMPYEGFELKAEGGITDSYQWSVISGGLPLGLSLDGKSGKISGTPTQAGSFSFGAMVRDTIEGQDTEDFNFSVHSVQCASLEITTACPLAKGEVGEEPDESFSLEGCGSSYNWEIISGALPEGLSLTASTGEVKGKPVQEGLFNFTVEVRDEYNNQDALPCSIEIEPAPPSPPDLESVSGFIAQGSDSKIGLAWINPTSKDFDQVQIIRSSNGFPQKPEEGEVIYSGENNNTVDTTAVNGSSYYYSAFAFDSHGYYAALNEDSKVRAMAESVSLFGMNDPCLDEVIDYKPLDPLTAYGSQNLPNVVLGAPKGGGQFYPLADVVSLHAKVNNDGGQSAPYGGSITVKFSDNIVVNGPGVDFTIFENAFQIGGKIGQYFIEPAVVEVSYDGVNYHRFPINFVYEGGGQVDVYSPATYQSGFAGIRPVCSNNGVPDPTIPSDQTILKRGDPLLFDCSKPDSSPGSGGDSFDLDNISTNLTWIRYVRITSTGDNWIKDRDGDYVRHTNEAGGSQGASGVGNSGFDLDAACAVHY